MKKYEEEHYRYEKIKDCIYPWVKEELRDSKALNGKNISEKDTPVIAFAGDLKIIFAIKRGEESYEILKDNMLPPEVDAETLYHTACENLVRDVEFVIGNTWYGGFGIIADGIHEASALCFKHIWQVCVGRSSHCSSFQRDGLIRSGIQRRSCKKIKRRCGKRLPCRNRCNQSVIIPVFEGQKGTGRL